MAESAIPNRTPQRSATPTEQELCRQGDTLKNRWEIVSKLGAGGFGQIYIAKDLLISNVSVAVKVESSAKKEKAQLPMELVVLRRYQGFPHAVQLYGAGTHKDLNFIVMELVGPNLAKLRRLMKDPHCFTISTTMRLNLQCVESIRDIHTLGAIHRDIKPSNFAMGLPNKVNKSKLYVLDFGLARFQTDVAGHILPPRNEASFQGTLRYCSIATHLRKDVGRKDDLISLFYMIIEFLKGTLPWKDLNNAKEVLKSKQYFTLERLAADHPVQLQQFATYLLSLEYADKPNYNNLLSLIQNTIEEYAGDRNEIWDWENEALLAPPRIKTFVKAE